MRKSVLLAIVVVFGVLAGCGALSGDDASGGEYPSAGEIDQSVVDGHVSALSDASFTAEITSNTTRVTGTQTTGVTFRVDPADDRYLQTYAAGAGNATLYTEGDASYQRTRTADGTTVRRVSQTVNASLARRASGVYNSFVSENVTYERVGNETFEGTEVVRYEADGLESVSQQLRNTTGENTTLTDFSATMLLDGDGVIRHYTVAYDTQWNQATVNSSIVVSVSDVGATDVQRPGWIDEANATAAQP